MHRCGQNCSQNNSLEISSVALTPINSLVFLAKRSLIWKQHGHLGPLSSLHLSLVWWNCCSGRKRPCCTTSVCFLQNQREKCHQVEDNRGTDLQRKCGSIPLCHSALHMSFSYQCLYLLTQLYNSASPVCVTNTLLPAGPWDKYQHCILHWNVTWYG